jgi:hippurate hydrolase
MMSRSCEVTVTVRGKAAHIGKAHLGKDAMAACVDFYHRAVQMEEKLDPTVFRLLKFGRMACGSVRNVIAEEAVLEGSLRTFDDAVFAQMKERLSAIACRVEEETGCTVEVHMNEGYPAVYNDPVLYARVAHMIPVAHLEQPSIITEDFSCYQHHVPGVFFFLGVGDTPALHAADFDFDEAVLLQGAEALSALVRNL